MLNQDWTLYWVFAGFIRASNTPSRYPSINNNNNNSLHLYSAFLLFLSTQSALHCGGVSPRPPSLFIRLHWLPVAARIKFKVLMFAYKTTTGTAPIYLNSLVQTYAPSRSLRSASERRLVVPSQRGTKSLSRTFSWTVPSWWNDLPISIRTAESLAIFKKHLKTHLFRQHLTN